MTDNLQGEMRRWQQLKQEAIEGEFQMEEGIGEALRRRCETLLAGLQDMKTDAAQLAYLSGYGDLPSAKIMKVKFERKADGGGSHDANDSAVARLQQHIEVVQMMHDTYAAAIGKLQATDEAAGTRIDTQTGEIR
ncbi:hypothetical protein [Nocardia amamiensis]|uniref:hypothetical protein n=1 Tax=Nocardia amamiensis TaxID=404578 RepID=UPI000834CE72|nr:hypothetical protein [Nocardia amamiensis]